uniref:Uncharacterized protein n=1 Tax=Siphoviridae sp. ctOkv13 TaxID=2826314 RepID=A0A8S5M3D8_9CAUD|nr:MAG TPA: Protein of unknown function (DUF3195) [Siphoviridae sp. ctOkv13]
MEKCLNMKSIKLNIKNYEVLYISNSLQFY